MDRTEEWRMFVEVASRRSFSAAARHLGRSPQSITRAIAALEARLATRLLHRTTRAVSLTTDGERLLTRARSAVTELDALETSTTDAAHAALTGTLTVTAPVAFGTLHVLPVIQQFLTAHPATTVRLSLLDRVVALAEEGIDLAVRIGALPDSALRALKVGEVRTVLVAAPSYLAARGAPRTLASLADHTCIAFSGTTPIPDRWTFDRTTIPIHPRLTVNTAAAAIAASLAGVGIARVLSYQVAEHLAANRLQRLLPRTEPPAVPVQLVTLPGIQSRLTVAFAEAAATQLRARLSD